MSPSVESQLQALTQLPARQRVPRLVEIAESLADAVAAGDPPSNAAVQAAVDAIVHLLHAYGGPAKERMRLGEALGRIGDPRLRVPADADYWVTVELDAGPIHVGRYPVTIDEWQRFVRDGGYERDDIWTDEGRTWRDSGRRLWPELAARPEVRHLVVPNQPVVGITWFEAQAYARAHDARLLTFTERLRVVRGSAKRPYPWGEPFGVGNANTAEEVLGKPCAVGLYETDSTPDGVFDLAGNVAEWTADVVGEERIVAPGSWEQPSMASWAKARELVEPTTRGADLGFRIARD